VPTPREQLADVLRQSRLDAGYESHGALAKRLNVSRPVITRAENAAHPVPSDAVLAAWVLAVEPYTAERLDELVAARLERQAVIGRAYLTAVIDQHVLHRLIGSAPVMAEQCAHLASMAASLLSREAGGDRDGNAAHSARTCTPCVRRVFVAVRSCGCRRLQLHIDRSYAHRRDLQGQ
jgi:hypothetical protein